MRTDLRVMRTKLFGDEDQETAQGRLPRLEATVASHGLVLDKWKPVHFVLRAAWLLLLGFGAYLFRDVFPLFTTKGH